MAQRLCLGERVGIEAMSAAGFSVGGIAERFGRRRSRVSRELAASGGRCGYRAVGARTAACQRARRPKAPKLVAQAGLAAAVAERLKRPSRGGLVGVRGDDLSSLL